MSDLDEARRSRTAAQGWVTRAKVKVEKEINKGESVELVVLEASLQDFEKRLDSWQAKQEAVELLVSSDQLDMEIAEAGDLFDEWFAIKVEGQKLLDILKKSKISDKACASTIKLPKLDIPRFDGSILKYTTWSQSYKVSIHDSGIPKIQKFSYLVSLLTGEASKVIEGLALSSENYDKAWAMIEAKYGRKELIVFSHIQALMELPVVKGNASLQQVKELQANILVHVRSLETLGIDGSMYGVILTPLILMRLPNNIRLEWARDSVEKEGDLNHLLTFLHQEIDRRERCEVFGDARKSAETSSAAQLSIQSNTAKKTSSRQGGKMIPSCQFCKKNHATAKCFAFQKLSLGDRRDFVKRNRLCYRCLSSGHYGYDCTMTCALCNGNHHELCCSPKESLPKEECKSSSKLNTESQSTDSQATVGLIADSQQLFTIMPTICVTAKGQQQSKEGLVMLLDTGSDRTYITEKVATMIKAKKIEEVRVNYTSFANNVGKKTTRSVYSFTASAGGADLELEALSVPIICAPMVRHRVPTATWELISKSGVAPLADGRNHSKLEIDILVGLDTVWKILTPDPPRMICDTPPLVAQKSIFGYVLSGSVKKKETSTGPVSTTLICPTSFWDLETIGIKGEDVSECSDAFFNDYIQDKIVYRSEERRYEVSLPWKEPRPELLPNLNKAAKFVVTLYKNMDSDIKKCYEEVFQEWEESGIISEVPQEEIDDPVSTVHYLTHRPVIRENNVTTKVRPVFNASLPGRNRISLNDCLNSGPCLLPRIMAIFIRFRRWPVAVIADFVKAFLQLVMAVTDRDVHRFLLIRDGLIRHMRFNRVTFGVTSSPFLLNAAVRYHLSLTLDDDPSALVVIQELLDNLYVDDWLSGANSVEEAGELYKKAEDIMSRASLTFSKQRSNQPIFSDSQEEIKKKEDVVKVMGLLWSTHQDCFLFTGLSISSSEEVVITKRTVLSIMARVYDPMGFLLPCIMALRILFQDCWKSRLPWDDVLSGELELRAKRWIEGIDTLKRIKIPRSYSECMLPWSDNGIELFAYADASKRGFGCCVYIRIQKPDGHYVSSLVLARARVAPIDPTTLPRLELLGCLLAARAVTTVANALNLELPTYRCFTDSTIALAWIQTEPSYWKQWVANRVREIRTLTDPTKWSHTPGIDNPADLVTRGIDSRKLIDNDFWFKGPSYLTQNDIPETCLEVKVSHEVITLSVAEEAEEVVLLNPVQMDLFDIERWGSYIKAQRIVAWTKRFIHNCRCKRRLESPLKDDLTVQELRDAQNLLIRQEQNRFFMDEIRLLKAGKKVPRSSKLHNLNPYLDDAGLLRRKARTDYFPILLPKSHLAKILVRFTHNILFHLGVNGLINTITSEFWIIGIRCIAKSVKKSCIDCQKHDAKAFNEIAAPLRKDRISKSPPFSVSGVDYAGPLYCSDDAEKLYILLFTCAITRALHLELVCNQSHSVFMLAFRRFAARRGRPRIMYSDNGKSFQSAANELVRYLGSQAPEWKFIPPKSPWWGGFWERMVKTVKASLRKTLGRKLLTRIELETLLIEIEACVNSRPITYVSTDVNSNPKALTPNDFLSGVPSGLDNFNDYVDISELKISEKELSEREQERLLFLNDCWKRWSSDYLRSLPSCVAEFEKRGNIEVGRLVLIHEDKPCPRLSWSTGIVVKLHYGIDGVCRSVDVKTPKGIRTRDIRRLHNLELTASSNDWLPENRDSDSTENNDSVNNVDEDEVDENSLSEPVVTRHGRTVKPRNVLNL